MYLLTEDLHSSKTDVNWAKLGLKTTQSFLGESSVSRVKKYWTMILRNNCLPESGGRENGPINYRVFLPKIEVK